MVEIIRAKKKKTPQIKHSTPKRLTGAESHLRLFRLSSKRGNRTCVGKENGNNLKTQHLNCSRRESNFTLVCRSSARAMPILLDIGSCARLISELFRRRSSHLAALRWFNWPSISTSGPAFHSRWLNVGFLRWMGSVEPGGGGAETFYGVGWRSSPA